MPTPQRTEISGLRDADSGATIGPAEFNRCDFVGGVLSLTNDPALRTTVRGVRLLDCSNRGCTVYSAVLDGVVVDGLRTHSLLQLWATAFRHVIVRGKVDRVMVSNRVRVGRSTAAEDRAFAEANAAFYRSVDWALDIREARFQAVELFGIPGRLVHRDPATTALVTRRAIEAGGWRGPRVAGTAIEVGLERLLESGLEDVVLVASYARDREAIHELRGEGFTDESEAGGC